MLSVYNDTIMKKKNQLQCLSVLLIPFFIAVGCTSTKKALSSYVGTWNYTVYNTPEGNITDIFRIDQVNDQLKGEFRLMGYSLEMEDLQIADNKLTANVSVEGYKAQLTGEFTKDVFKGKARVDYNEFRIEATKSK